MPELGTLIDEANEEVNSANVAPISEWKTPKEHTATPNVISQGKSEGSEQSTPSGATADDQDEIDASEQPSDDDDYAEICRSESVKNGLKSLKQDLEEAQKDERNKRSMSFFLKKLKLQWATLKACIRDPMQKAVLEKLEQDPIILDSE